MNILPGGGLSVCAGVMQGAFPLPMKYAKSWKWENTWSAFALWGFVILPWLWAFLTVPNLVGVYACASGRALAAITFFGAGWGIGTICFGIGVRMVGLALGSAMIIGTAGALGTLIPMIVFHGDAFRTPGGLAITGGVALMLLGVGICAVAGSQREKMQRAGDCPNFRVSENGTVPFTQPAEAKSFRKGLLVCMISGLASPMLNFAFAFGGEIVTKAEAAGTLPAHASNPIWCWTMTCAFVVTLLYCACLMIKDRGWQRFLRRGTGFYWGLAILMGLLWSGSIAVYGIALSMLGPLAPSLGWPILMISTIITGNLCGITTGEWKGSGRKPLATMLLGLGVLVLAICVVGAGSG